VSLLGRDFELAMIQLKATLAAAEVTLNELREAVAKANALLSKIQIK
jgi:multidrug resistance efflux pump